MTRLAAVALASGVLVVVLLVATPWDRGPDPPYDGPDELAEAVSEVGSYGCDSNDVIVNKRRFERGAAEEGLCILYRDGQAVFGGGAGIRLVVITPPDAMDEFLAANRKADGRQNAIIGENWVIPAPRSDDRVTADLLAGLEGARMGRYGLPPP